MSVTILTVKTPLVENINKMLIEKSFSESFRYHVHRFGPAERDLLPRWWPAHSDWVVRAEATWGGWGGGGCWSVEPYAGTHTKTVMISFYCGTSVATYVVKFTRSVLAYVPWAE